jgi:alpha-beta hydrolase superfamily lysophospholipase
MRRRTAILLALLATLAGALLLGPRPRLDADVEPPLLPTAPAALDAHIRNSEARFGDIVPGAEQRIAWQGGTPTSPTAVSVVYLHGFSATHRETAPFTERLADSLGAHAFLARLAGHGRTGEAMGAATGQEWLEDTALAVEAGLRLGERVILVGVSTGGTLALWAAAQPRWRERVAAVVLVSPNFGVRDPTARIMAWPWGGLVTRMVVGPEHSFQPHNEAQERYWTSRYPTRVLPHMQAVVNLMTPRLLDDVAAPVLIFYNPDDQVVQPASIADAAHRLGATRVRLADVASAAAASPRMLVEVRDVGDPSQHVLAGQILSPAHTDSLVAAALSFLRRR